MQKSTLISVLLLASFAAGLAYTRPKPQDPEATPLEAAMDGLQDGQRKLRKLLRDAGQKDACLEVVRSMRGSALTAFGLPPAPPESMEESARPAWRIGFQRQILKVVDELLALELAVEEGRSDAAQEAYHALGALKKEGHDTYQKE